MQVGPVRALGKSTEKQGAYTSTAHTLFNETLARVSRAVEPNVELLRTESGIVLM
jgi:hypothetical protein